MKLRRRRFIQLATSVAVLSAGSRLSRAQAYPSRSITLVVPFPPGGSTDVAGRILADRMAAALGQPVIIENVGGAGGSIGVGRVARATPDGYTIDIGQWDTLLAIGCPERQIKRLDRCHRRSIGFGRIKRDGNSGNGKLQRGVVMSGMRAERRFPLDRNPFTHQLSQVSPQRMTRSLDLGGVDLNLIERFLRIEKLISCGANGWIQRQDVSRLGRIALPHILIIRRACKDAVGQGTLKREADRFLDVGACGMRGYRRQTQGQDQRKPPHSDDRSYLRKLIGSSI